MSREFSAVCTNILGRESGIWRSYLNIEGLDPGFLHRLKGQCHEIFYIQFFHQSAPSGPIRGTLVEFHILTYFRELWSFKIDSPVVQSLGSQSEGFLVV